MIVAVVIVFLVFMLTMLGSEISDARLGLIVGPSVILPIMFGLMIAFVIFADRSFLAAHPARSDAREFRGVHLGLNLTGMFVFPIFSFIASR